MASRLSCYKQLHHPFMGADSILAALLPIQFPANGLGEYQRVIQVLDLNKAYMGDLEEAPGPALELSIY